MTKLTKGYPTNGYELYRYRQEQIADLIQRVIDILGEMKLNTSQKHVQGLKETLLRSSFKVLVLGEFKTGKSTFINALLGEEVLPSFATPTTAVINEVKYGEKKRALLYYKDPDQSPNPKEIPVTELEDYVVIKDSEEEINESPYEKVEIYWPLDLLHNQVEIIDSPGLNENKVREDVTRSYLYQADAILFVFTALRFGPAIHEQDMLATLNQFGHEYLFFIINRYDMLRARDRDKVREHAQSKLQSETKRENGIFFLSSLDALEGRLDDDEELVQGSGILELESELETFLTDDRGRIKLLRSVQELKQTIRTLYKLIPEREELIQQDLPVLEARYRETDRELQQLELEAESIIRRVSHFRVDLRELVRSRVQGFYTNLETLIDDWMQDYEFKTKFSIGDMLRVNRYAKQISQEVAEYLSNKVEGEFRRWGDDELQPFVTHQFSILWDDLSKQAEIFEGKLERARLIITGVGALENQVIDPTSEASSLERILAAAGGWILGNPMMAAMGGVFGLEGLVRSILPQMLAVMGALIIGLPVLPVVLVAAMLQGARQVSSIADKVKEDTITKLKEKIRDDAPAHAQEIANGADAKILELEKQLETGLNARIAEIREQAESVLEAKRQGEIAVQEQLQKLRELTHELNEIEGKTEDFVTQLLS